MTQIDRATELARLREAPADWLQVPMAQWKDAYAAFQGEFDTPLARRRNDSEYARDARRRLREINDAALSQEPTK